MATKRDIQEKMENLKTLQALTDAYAEIASRRMKKTRDSVVSTRDFLASLEDVFNQVRAGYRRQVEALKKRKGAEKERITFLSHNGKTVSVFLSANAGLFGDIIPKVFLQFVDEVNTLNSEVTIIGRLGRELYLQKYGKSRPYTYFDYPDVGTSAEELNKIITHLVPYEEIRIHYGQFMNVARQEPKIYNISAQTSITIGEEKQTQIQKYLFEPTLEEILVFFETEMFGSLLDQTMRESQLAKFASRMLAMDKAYENIQDRIKAERMIELRVMHATEDRKQRTLFSSMKLWKR